jgi:hypothetical protein
LRRRWDIFGVTAETKKVARRKPAETKGALEEGHQVTGTSGTSEPGRNTMNIRTIALAAAAVLAAGIPAQSLAFDASAEYSVHSLSQTRDASEARDNIRALGVPSETAAIGDRQQVNEGYGIDPAAEYSTSTDWQPMGFGN